MSTATDNFAELLAPILGELRAITAAVKGLRADYARHTTQAAPQARSGAQATTGGQSGAKFGNYGRSKNQPVYGASESDLDYYAAGCRRTLADHAKARFHDTESVLLAAIESELLRQRGGSSGGGQGSPTGNGAPPDFGTEGGFDTDIPFSVCDGAR